MPSVAKPVGVVPIPIVAQDEIITGVSARLIFEIVLLASDT